MAWNRGSQHESHRAPTHAPALVIRGLWKYFEHLIAVAGIDLTVPTGSFYGLIGPNGAGKTTTLSIATGLLRPDAGSVHVHGHSLWPGLSPPYRAHASDDAHAAKACLGVLPDGSRLFDMLTGAQFITYAGLLRGMDRDTVAHRTRNLLDALDLTGAADRLVLDYSAGMTKKIALASALIHAPAVLVLDEPFEAVDPVSAATIRDILQHYVTDGGTVIMSTHDMGLVERVCDHVAIVAHGHILAAGTLNGIRGTRTLEDVFVTLVGGPPGPPRGLAWLHT